MILVTTGRCYFSVGIYSGTIIRVWVFFLTMVPLALCQDKNCERFYLFFIWLSVRLIKKSGRHVRLCLACWSEFQYFYILNCCLLCLLVQNKFST